MHNELIVVQKAQDIRKSSPTLRHLAERLAKVQLTVQVSKPIVASRTQFPNSSQYLINN